MKKRNNRGKGTNRSPFERTHQARAADGANCLRFRLVQGRTTENINAPFYNCLEIGKKQRAKEKPKSKERKRHLQGWGFYRNLVRFLAIAADYEELSNDCTTP